MGWVIQRKEQRQSSGFQMLLGNNIYEREEAEEDWMEDEGIGQSKRGLWN